MRITYARNIPAACLHVPSNRATIERIYKKLYQMGAKKFNFRLGFHKYKKIIIPPSSTTSSLSLSSFSPSLPPTPTLDLVLPRCGYLEYFNITSRPLPTHANHWHNIIIQHSLIISMFVHFELHDKLRGRKRSFKRSTD